MKNLEKMADALAKKIVSMAESIKDEAEDSPKKEQVIGQIVAEVKGFMKHAGLNASDMEIDDLATHLDELSYEIDDLEWDTPDEDDEEAVDDYNSNVDYAQERVITLKDRIEELRKEASGQTAERLDELLEIAEDLDDRADCLYL